MTDTEERGSWGRSTLMIFSTEFGAEEFQASIDTLGVATGEVSVRRTRAGHMLWRDRTLLGTASTAKDLWEWAVAEVDAVLGQIGGPPPGCTAELWLGLDVPLQRGLWCEADQLLRVASRKVDLVLDLYA